MKNILITGGGGYVGTNLTLDLLKEGYKVTVLDDKKKYYEFDWIVQKYDKSGPLENCWLTTGVSQPLLLGSSI